MFALFRARPAVRRIGPEAAADCAGLHAGAFAHPWSQHDLEAMLADAAVVAHGATLRPRGALAGFILSRTAADEAELLTLAVAPKARRAGLGRGLLAANMADLAAAGATTLFLEVNAGNSGARALYGAFGFAEVGTRPAYYRAADSGRATALVLRRDL